MTITDASHPTVSEQPWWRELESFYTSVFHETWWRDIVAKNGGKTAFVREYDDFAHSAVGELDYEVRTRWLLLSRGTQPLETHIVYIFIDPGFEDGAAQYSRQRQITRKLAITLPRWRSYSFTLHQDVDAGIVEGFRDAGFTIVPQRTYVIPPPATSDNVDRNVGNKGANHDGSETLTGNLTVVWGNLPTKLRTKIRKGNAALRIEESTDVAKFIEFYSETLRAKGKKNRLNPTIVSQILQTSIERGHGILLFLSDRERIHAASAFLKDEKYLYYYLVAYAPDCHHDAIRSIIWSGIKMALKHERTFDLNGVPFGDDGTLHKQIDDLYQEFRGIPVERFVAKKENYLQLTATQVRSIARKALRKLAPMIMKKQAE